jgi:zinc metalloprotease ZmpB
VRFHSIRLLALLACALVALTAAPAATSKSKPPDGGGSSPGSTGTGRVFFPNPVALLDNQSLADQDDADYEALQPAYRVVTLTNLDGSGQLRGDWADVRGGRGEKRVASPTNAFLFGRADDGFEQVMAYYWITEAQRYVQSLGFGVWRRPINKAPQAARVNQLRDDSSVARLKKDEIHFGSGGVDDAEDADVILHEYGHTMHFSQAPGFYQTAESAAIGEGFSDYWAVTVTQVVAPTADPACVADWDATAYTVTVPHCLRRVDRDVFYPRDLAGDIHRDGRIWSRALWEIRKSLGNVVADTVILEAQFDVVGPTMPQLARTTVDTAQRLYGPATADKVEAAFAGRGILQM